MNMPIKTNISALKAQLRVLRKIPRGMETAAVRALNKTVKGVRTDAVKMIRQDYNFKAATVRDSLKVALAGPGQFSAWLYGSGGYGVPLIEFGVTPRRAPSTRRLRGGRYSPEVGISARVRKDKKHTFPGYFTARLSSGHIGVFYRDRRGKKMRSKNKTAIKQAFGPTPIKLLHGGRYDEALTNIMNERWPKNLNHEARHVLRQQGLLAD